MYIIYFIYNIKCVKHNSGKKEKQRDILDGMPQRKKGTRKQMQCSKPSQRPDFTSA